MPSASTKTWRVIRQAVSKAFADDLTGRAAQLAYFFFLSIFPLLITLIAFAGIVPYLREHVWSSVPELAARFLPRSAASLVEKILTQVINGARATKVSIGIVATIWSGSSGMAALIEAMNAEYGIAEDRPYWKHQGIAILLSIASGILFLLAGAILLVSGSFLGPTLSKIWQVCRWPLALALVLLALSVIYHYAPNLRRAQWKWITPGAIVGLLLWLGGSYGFNVYLRYFNTYGAVYGSLGTVIIAMLWFYISSLAILLGGEVNAVLEGAATITRAEAGKSEEATENQQKRRAAGSGA